jgi:curved DNA-binding protein CbpA
MWRVDYYAILEVGEGATREEIRRAYRALAKRHHPDRHQGDRTAEMRFKQIAAAYSVLNDPEMRSKYDASRLLWDAAFPPTSGHQTRAAPSTGRGAAEPQAPRVFELGGKRVVVSAEWVQVGEQKMSVASVTGIRYGSSKEGIVARRSYAVWLTDGQSVLSIECGEARRFQFLGRSAIETKYNELLDALLAAVRVPIMTRMVVALESGTGFEVGDVLCDGYGFHRFVDYAKSLKAILNALTSLVGGPTADEFGIQAAHLAWEDLGSYKVVEGQLVLYDRLKNKWTGLSLRDDWNAVCLPALFRALSQG